MSFAPLNGLAVQTNSLLTKNWIHLLQHGHESSWIRKVIAAMRLFVVFSSFIRFICSCWLYTLNYGNGNESFRYTNIFLTIGKKTYFIISYIHNRGEAKPGDEDEEKLHSCGWPQSYIFYDFNVFFFSSFFDHFSMWR